MPHSYKTKQLNKLVSVLDKLYKSLQKSGVYTFISTNIKSLMEANIAMSYIYIPSQSTYQNYSSLIISLSKKLLLYTIKASGADVNIKFTLMVVMCNIFTMMIVVTDIFTTVVIMSDIYTVTVVRSDIFTMVVMTSSQICICSLGKPMLFTQHSVFLYYKFTTMYSSLSILQYYKFTMVSVAMNLNSQY